MSEKWKYFEYPKAKPPFYKITTVPTKEKMHYETVATCNNEKDAKRIVADHNKTLILEAGLKQMRDAIAAFCKDCGGECTQEGGKVSCPLSEFKSL